MRWEAARVNMSNEEILVSFKQSAKPLQQIRILAELNGTDQETIRQILEQQGVESSVLRRKAGVRKKNTPPPALTIVDTLAGEEKALMSRIQNIEELIPTLERELKSLSVKLAAVQQARFALAEVYGGGAHETD